MGIKSPKHLILRRRGIVGACLSPTSLWLLFHRQINLPITEHCICQFQLLLCDFTCHYYESPWYFLTPLLSCSGGSSSLIGNFHKKWCPLLLSVEIDCKNKHSTQRWDERKNKKSWKQLKIKNLPTFSRPSRNDCSVSLARFQCFFDIPLLSRALRAPSVRETWRSFKEISRSSSPTSTCWWDECWLGADVTARDRVFILQQFSNFMNFAPRWMQEKSDGALELQSLQPSRINSKNVD